MYLGIHPWKDRAIQGKIILPYTEGRKARAGRFFLSVRAYFILMIEFYGGIKLKAAIIMGSISDREIAEKAKKIFDKFGVETHMEVISAHRTPKRAFEFAESAEKDGIEVIIAIAGKAAHLGGVIAANTIVPVIGIPAKTSVMGGMDSLLSVVQMPKGIPVATVAIDGGENAALLAISMLSLKYDELKNKLVDYRKELQDQVVEMNKELEA